MSSRKPSPGRLIRSRAYTITTRDPDTSLVVSEHPSRTVVEVSIFSRGVGGKLSVQLDELEWRALCDLRYDVEVDTPVEPEPAPEPTGASPLAVEGVPPAERAISLRSSCANIWHAAGPGRDERCPGCGAEAEDEVPF